YALGPQPGVGDVQPLRQPVAHEPEEQVVEGSVGLHGLQLAGLGPVGIVAVVGDEPFQTGEFGALGQLVALCDEGAVPPPVRPLDDRLDGLARHVPAEHEHGGLVHTGSVDELAEAEAGSVEVADEGTQGAAGHFRFTALLALALASSGSTRITSTPSPAMRSTS